MAWTFSAIAALVGKPLLWRDVTVPLAWSQRELLARADYSTSAFISSRLRLEFPLFRMRSRITARRFHSYKDPGAAIATTIFALSHAAARCPDSPMQNKYMEGERRGKIPTACGRNDDRRVVAFVRFPEKVQKLVETSRVWGNI
jgi:hypothetical protein